VPDHFTFEDFLGLATNLDEALNPGGLLCIYNTSYLFRELPFAGNYHPVRTKSASENGFVPKWSSSGEPLTTDIKIWPFRFHKVLAPAQLESRDFTDTVFRKASGDAEVLDAIVPRNSSSKWIEAGPIESARGIVAAIAGHILRRH
jgi:hypothetical protein